MPKVLFAWELGMGFGHMMPYLNLVRLLNQRGWQTYFATRNVGDAEKIFQSEAISFIQSPALYGGGRKVNKNGRSYCDVLYNTGFADVDHLAGRLKAWRFIFDSVKPDLVIYDGAPAASLMSRNIGCKRIMSGTGFFLPPDDFPIPNVKFWEKVDREDLLVDEQNILKTVNEALARINEPPISEVREFLQSDDRFLMNFNETDHYGKRSATDYIGTFPSLDYGKEYPWPDIEGKKIFGYIAPFKTLPSLFAAMSKLKISATLYCPKVSKKLRTKYQSERIRFVDEPADLAKVSKDCDLAITNGNLSSTVTFLLYGKPLLTLPTTLERQVVGFRVQKLGAGLSAPLLKPKGMVSKLITLLRDPKYTEAAEEFSNRYANLSKETQIEQMMQRIDRLLPIH